MRTVLPTDNVTSNNRLCKDGLLFAIACTWTFPVSQNTCYAISCLIRVNQQGAEAQNIVYILFFLLEGIKDDY